MRKNGVFSGLYEEKRRFSCEFGNPCYNKRKKRGDQMSKKRQIDYGKLNIVIGAQSSDCELHLLYHTSTQTYEVVAYGHKYRDHIVGGIVQLDDAIKAMISVVESEKARGTFHLVRRVHWRVRRVK